MVTGAPHRLAPGALEALHGTRAVEAWCVDDELHIAEGPAPPHVRVLGSVPALDPADLGDRSFLRDHGVRYPYAAGALAGGIASVEMVVSMARAGMMAGFGAGGLELPRVERAIHEIHAALGRTESFEINLLHDPFDPQRELAFAQLYLRERIRRVSASGYMAVTAPIVLYRASGLSALGDGRVAATNHVLAKVSRPEVAESFLSPAPASILRELVAAGRISHAQAELAARVPVAEDVTVEGDSGGHTDRQALVPLLSTIADLRDRIVARRGYMDPVRVGAAGGIATPSTVAAAFAAGAAYVVTGSINQASCEAATSPLVKQMLAGATLGRTDMAPAGDMFESGARVQVLAHRTLFAARASKLHELWRAHRSWEELSEKDRQHVETRILRRAFDDVWEEVEGYLRAHRPSVLDKAIADPRAKLAAVFKWYMHHSSRWATEGVADRAADFQIWCGPAMAAFNQWVQGSFLERLEERHAPLLALNLLYGGAALLRARILSFQGVHLPPAAFSYAPRRFDLASPFGRICPNGSFEEHIHG